MLKIKNRLIALVLSGITLTGCNNTANFEVEIPAHMVENMNNILSNMNETNEKEKVEPEKPVDTDSIAYNTNIINVVVADTNTPIMNGIFPDSALLGTLAKDRNFVLISDEDPEWYAIRYYGDVGFVKKEDTHISVVRTVNTPMIGKGYLPKEATIYDTKDMNTPIDMLNELEFVEIYKEVNDCYLVQTIDYKIGYIRKDDVTLIEGDLVVGDISEQRVDFYEGNTKVFSAPVVSGTINTSRETDLGLTTILSKWGAGEIAPGAYVRCVAYFNNTYEGFHTAEWREPYEFGGDTYTYDGSHGCMNMRLEDGLELCDHLEVGDPCLIKM